ncbi:HAD family hydrolase [Microbacterium karelineae]|uniref:HAD family hydrolase n=1 Tax=Microbacterium karelineae TaxID=2654283 RepID=UPI0012EAE138|nr:HAD family hydrolase [Microbacterium karelineae]
MTRTRAVLFDLDGTLVDQESALRRAVAEWGAELSLPESGLVDRWRRISSRHYARYQAREISFAEQRRERVRELLGRDLDDAGPTGDPLTGRVLSAGAVAAERVVDPPGEASIGLFSCLVA